MFFTQPLGLSVLVCVCVCVCACPSVITFEARWLDLATWCQVRSIYYLQELENATLFKMIRFRFRFIWTIWTKSHFGL